MSEESFAEKVARLQREIAVRQSELSALVLGDPRVSVSIGSCGTCGGVGFTKEALPEFPKDRAVRWKRCTECKSRGSQLENSLIAANMTVDQYWADRGN